MLVEACCPRCQSEISFDSAFTGTKRTCKSCGATFTLERPSRKAEPPAAVADKGDRPVLFETTCQACAHAFTINAAFAGSKRTCPSCSHVFVLELPAAVKAQVQARKQKLYGQVERDTLGCASCLRFGSALRAEAAKVYRCQYCGLPTPLDEALTLAPLISKLESEIIVRSLAGVSAKEFVASAGPRVEMIKKLVERIHPMLGKLRHGALAAKNRGEAIVLGTPANCDGCFGSGPLDPFSLVWSRVEEESTGLHAASALTVFAGVLVTEKRRVVRHIEEVEYLCQQCKRNPPPPELGFTLEKAFALPPL